MSQTSLFLVILSIGMLGCSKPKTNLPAANAQPKEIPDTRTIEKAAKPSPYKPKAPRQVTAVTRDAVPQVPSVPANSDTSRPE
jgi:hypothetical protein